MISMEPEMPLFISIPFHVYAVCFHFPKCGTQYLMSLLVLNEFFECHLLKSLKDLLQSEANCDTDGLFTLV